MQGFRIDLASASVDWIKRTLGHLRDAEAASGIYTAVILDTIGPEIRVRPPPANAAAIAFTAGAPVALDRTPSASLSPSTVPIICRYANELLGSWLCRFTKYLIRGSTACLHICPFRAQCLAHLLAQSWCQDAHHP